MSANCPPSAPCVQANLAKKASGIQCRYKPERQEENCLSQLPLCVFPPPLGPWEVAAALVEGDGNVHSQQQKSVFKNFPGECQCDTNQIEG